MQFQVAVDHRLQVFERAQLALVVRIRLGRPLPAGRRDGGEPGRHAGWRKVLRHTVVFVPAAVLARFGHVQVTDRAHARI